MTDIMEATKSKVKDVAGEKISDSPGKEDQDAGTSKNSILENLVTSVKRKLNQSLSPNSQKQEELGGTGLKVTAPKRSRGGPGSRTDLDDSLIIDEYERKPWQKRFLGLVPHTPSPLQLPEHQTAAARPGQIQGERGRVNTPNEEQPMDITIKPLSTRL